MRWPPPLFRDERGATVVETIVASALFVVVLLSVLSVLDSGTRAERGTQSRHDALLEVRRALSRITKEVRQAESLASTSTRTRLQVGTLDGDTVVYELTANDDLVRQVGASPAFVLLSDVTNEAPFCFDPPGCTATTAADGPRSIRVDLSVQPSTSTAAPVTLTTDVQLRNI